MTRKIAYLFPLLLQKGNYVMMVRNLGAILATKGDNMTDEHEHGSLLHDQLWLHVKSLNEMWVSGNPDKLDPFFHNDVVVLHFDYKTRLRGREAVIASYHEFCEESTVNTFKQFKPIIDIFGNTAVVTYAFEIEYEMGGQVYNESGRDMFVFLQEDSDWLAVWRTMLPDPPENSGTSIVEMFDV